MSRDLSIIFFGSKIKSDWGWMWQREQELANRLSEHCDVLYVQRLWTGSLNSTKVLKGVLKRLKPPSPEVADKHSITFLSPVKIPFTQDYNSNIIFKKLQTILSGISSKKILWMAAPLNYALPSWDKLEVDFRVYDCVQPFPHSPWFPDSQRIDRKFAEEADAVFADSITIFNDKKLQNPNCYQIPQGINDEIFSISKADHLNDEPDDLKDLKRPLIGYIGSFHSSFDIELVKKLAKKVSGTIVLIGPIEGSENLVDIPNIRRLGFRRHNKLPEYLKNFDLNIIPYKINKHTNGVYPTKLWEYFWSKKPTLSSYLPDLEALKLPNVWIARNHDDFIDLANRLLLKELTYDLIDEDWLKILSENSWDKRVAEIMKIFDEKVREKN